MICHLHSSTIKHDSWHHHGVTTNDDDAFCAYQKQIYRLRPRHLTPSRNHFSVMHTWTVGFFVIERHTFMTRHVWEPVEQKKIWMLGQTHSIVSCWILSTHCVCFFSRFSSLLIAHMYVISIPTTHHISLDDVVIAQKWHFYLVIWRNLDLIPFFGWRNLQSNPRCSLLEIEFTNHTCRRTKWVY